MIYLYRGSRGMPLKYYEKNKKNNITYQQYIEARKVVINYLSKKLKAPKISDKMIATELYVDAYIKKYNKPPTYQNIADAFGLKSKCAAYARLRRYRNKMKQK